MISYRKRSLILLNSIMQVKMWLKDGEIEKAAKFYSLWWYEYNLMKRNSDGVPVYQYSISKEKFIELVESFECDQLTEIVVKNISDSNSNFGPSLLEFLNENWRRYNTTNPRTKQEYLPFKT